MQGLGKWPDLIHFHVPMNVCKYFFAVATQLFQMLWLPLGSACAQAELILLIKPHVNFQGIQSLLQEFSLQ